MKKDEKSKSRRLHLELEKARTVILSGFEGITVAQDFDLRPHRARRGPSTKW